jgi:ligand-binding SRPBCC domain-containing protein
VRASNEARLMSLSRLEPLVRLLAADTVPPSGVKTLHRETIVPGSLEDTFAFFADASNLERLTPSWLNFKILTRTPDRMQQDAEIDYRITLYGLPIPWRSRIDVWEPGVRFVDRQVIGPYRFWRHEHRFDAVAGGTRVVDNVEYVPRARWLTDAVVRRDLERIFAYRQNTLRHIFKATGREREARDRV